MTLSPEKQLRLDQEIRGPIDQARLRYSQRSPSGPVYRLERFSAGDQRRHRSQTRATGKIHVDRA